ncbi:MAG: SdpI family protein, partial [Sphingomonadaceae bacterium]|nr:SdpI family protein [Sphingomonadaceae bacterium]
GEADRYAGKWTALMIGPGIFSLVIALFYFLPYLETRKKGLARSQGLYFACWAALLLVFIATHAAVLAAAFDVPLPTDRMIMGAIGLMFVMIGDQLGKSRSMYMIGIRTPWTLASEEVWIKTHRLGGKLMMLGGLAVVALAIFGVAGIALTVTLIAAAAVITLVPVVYSYLSWRREDGQESNG